MVLLFFCKFPQNSISRYALSDIFLQTFVKTFWICKFFKLLHDFKKEIPFTWPSSIIFWFNVFLFTVVLIPAFSFKYSLLTLSSIIFWFNVFLFTAVLISAFSFKYSLLTLLLMAIVAATFLYLVVVVSMLIWFQDCREFNKRCNFCPGIACCCMSSEKC